MMRVVNGWHEGPAKVPPAPALGGCLLNLAAPTGAALYAMVDAARDDRVMALLAGGGAPYQSLFQGSDKESLFSVGPFLVACEPGRPLPDWLTTGAWGAACGLFLVSKAPYGMLLAHLQQLLKVVTHDDRELFFRFYDPRVLRIFLPSCRPAVRWRFMGPIEHLLVAAESGDGVLAFSREDLDAPPADDEPVWRQPLFVAPEQLTLFSDHALTGFKARLKQHLTTRFGRQIEHLGLDGRALGRLVDNGMDRARMYGLRSEFDIQRYVEYMLVLSPDFDLDPDYAWAGQILFRSDLAGRRKLDLLDRAVLCNTKGEAT